MHLFYFWYISKQNYKVGEREINIKRGETSWISLFTSFLLPLFPLLLEISHLYRNTDLPLRKKMILSFNE